MKEKAETARMNSAGGRGPNSAGGSEGGVSSGNEMNRENLPTGNYAQHGFGEMDFSPAQHDPYMTQEDEQVTPEEEGPPDEISPTAVFKEEGETQEEKKTTNKVTTKAGFAAEEAKRQPTIPAAFGAATGATTKRGKPGAAKGQSPITPEAKYLCRLARCTPVNCVVTPREVCEECIVGAQGGEESRPPPVKEEEPSKIPCGGGYCRFLGDGPYEQKTDGGCCDYCAGMGRVQNGWGGTTAVAAGGASLVKKEGSAAVKSEENTAAAPTQQTRLVLPPVLPPMPLAPLPPRRLTSSGGAALLGPSSSLAGQAAPRGAAKAASLVTPTRGEQGGVQGTSTGGDKRQAVPESLPRIPGCIRLPAIGNRPPR